MWARGVCVCALGVGGLQQESFLGKPVLHLTAFGRRVGGCEECGGRGARALATARGRGQHPPYPPTPFTLLPPPHTPLLLRAVLLIRSNSDIDQIKTLLDEATFYDKQWSATWEGVERPSEAEMEGRA